MTPQDVIGNLIDMQRDPVTGEPLYDDVQVEFYASDVRETIQTIESQAARIAELERDAARYRWLRNCNGFGVYKFNTYPAECYFGTALDAAIDAAMQASPTPPQPQPEPR